MRTGMAEDRDGPSADQRASTPPESTLLDLLDNLLNKGVMAERRCDARRRRHRPHLPAARRRCSCAADRVLPPRPQLVRPAAASRRRGKPPLLKKRA